MSLVGYDVVVFNMKKIIFLTAAITYSLIRLGQKVALSAGVSISVTPGHGDIK